MKYVQKYSTVVVLVISGVWAWAQEPMPKVGLTAEPSSGTDASDLPKCILMQDGRILTGKVAPHKEGGWVVQQRLGPIRVESDDVEGIFPSLHAIYEHKRESLPPRDIQERLRLYQWCLSQNLLAEGREQLQAVLALSPDHEEAKSSLNLLEIRIARKDVPTDSGLMRTSATKQMNDGGRENDPVLTNRALREMAMRTAPVVLDLPEGLALKRAQEFNQYIHPLVQQYCASCHNERTPHGYDLISVSGRAARDPAILRANLDATLRLVDPENIMQSPLLVNSLLPHQPNNRPIFQGPNHPAYRLISNWVSNLKYRGYGNPAVSRGAEPVESGVEAPRFGSVESGGTVARQAEMESAGAKAPGFAVERVQAGLESREKLPIEANPQSDRGNLVPLANGSREAEPAMPGRFVPGSYNGGSTQAPKGTKFPVPISAGASPEELLKALQAEEADRDAREAAIEKNKKPEVAAEIDEPVAAQPVKKQPETLKPGDKNAKKPVKINQELLDQFLIKRRGGG